MKYAAIILGIIVASFLVPQNAFARGGSQKTRSDRRKPKVEVVTEPVVVTKHRRTRVVKPVVVKPVVKPVVIKEARRKTVHVERAAPRSHHQAHPEVRRESRRPQQASYGRRHGDARHGDARHGDARHGGPRHRDARHGGHRHHANCGWIEGHYEKHARKIVVPGFFRKEYVAAKYAERRGPRGIRFYVQVHPAGWRNVWVPPNSQVRYDHVWVEGHYTCGR